MPYDLERAQARHRERLKAATELTTLRARIAELEAEVAGCHHDIDSLRNSLNGEVDEVERQSARIAELEAQVASAAEHANKCYLGGIETGMDLERDRVVEWLEQQHRDYEGGEEPHAEMLAEAIAANAHRRPE